MAGGRNNEALKGAQWNEEVESLSAGRNDPGTRMDDALAAVMSRIMLSVITRSGRT